METGLKAFFYDYKYYLLPEDCENAEDIKKLKFTEVKRLKEEYCMAPDFVYESMETEFLNIEAPERIFPATVNLYSRKEYDELLLKQVKKRCPGCGRYTDDGTDALNGHHREMSLAGVCYSRADGRNDCLPVPFGRLAVWFWNRVAESANELAELTDAGDQKGINKLLNKLLTRFFVPLDFFCGIEEGKYCLCMSSNAYPHQGIRTLVKILAMTAEHEDSEIKAAGWKVYPYFSKGVYKPSLRPDYVKKPPRLFYGGEEWAEIVVYEKDADKWSERKAGLRKKAVYKYLCREVGENVLLAGSASLAVSEKLPDDKREVTAAELAELLEEKVKKDFDGEIPFPEPLFWETESLGEDALPYKEETRTWMTVCAEMTPERLTEDAGNTVFEPFGVVYAYVYLPGRFMDGPDAWKHEVWEKYIGGADNYPEPITMRDAWRIFARSVGVTFSPHGVCCDYMVTDEQEFFRVLRNLTPVLTGLNAKIVTVKRDGIIVYNPGYAILPEDSGLCS